MEIFIPGNVPSSKNSKVATSKGIFNSKTVTKYLRSLGIQSYSTSKKTVKGYVKRLNSFEILVSPLKEYIYPQSYPIFMSLHFIRNSRRRFDFVNVAQIILDLLVAHEVIQDDDMDHVIPSAYQINGEFYSYNKEHPGVWIYVP